MDISRRLFLCGTAATVLAAWSLSLPINATTVIQPVVAPLAYKRRKIWGLQMEPVEDFKAFPVGRVVSFLMRRHGAELPILKWQINSRGFLRWRANPGGEILDLGHQPIEILVEPDVQMAEIVLYFQSDDQGFQERHLFPGNQVELYDSFGYRVT